MFDDPTPSLFPVSSAKKARIEIIPLIDVIFFLLATFVLFTLSLNKIEAIDPVFPKAGDPESAIEPLILQVSHSGTVYWNKELVSSKELPTRLSAYASKNPAPRALISADDHAKYGDTILVLDELRKLNIPVAVETIYRPAGK